MLGEEMQLYMLNVHATVTNAMFAMMGLLPLVL